MFFFNNYFFLVLIHRKFYMFKQRPLSVCCLAALLSFPLAANAQLDDLFKELGNILPGKPAGNAAPNMPSVPGAAPKKAGGLMPSDQWCKQQAGSIAGMKINKDIIASEFKIADLEGLQDVFQKAFNKGKINKTFPSAKFFQASFETKKVRAIYDTFLAFPEPDPLAALIQLSRSSDEQERGDALMALVFLHLQASEASISPTRWSELHQAALKKEHYTAIEFRARINAYGELGPKNLAQSLGDLVSAGSLKNTYSQGRGGMKKEFDIQNYGVIHTATAKDIFFNEPICLTANSGKAQHKWLCKLRRPKSRSLKNCPEPALERCTQRLQSTTKNPSPLAMTSSRQPKVEINSKVSCRVSSL